MMPTFRLNRRPEDNAVTGRCAVTQAEGVPCLRRGVPFRYWEDLGDGEHPSVSLLAISEGRVTSDLGQRNRDVFEDHLASQRPTMPPLMRQRHLDRVIEELDRTAPPPYRHEPPAPWPFWKNEPAAYMGKATSLQELATMAGNIDQAGYAAMVKAACDAQGASDLLDTVTGWWPAGAPAPAMPIPADGPALFLFQAADGSHHLRIDRPPRAAPPVE